MDVQRVTRRYWIFVTLVIFGCLLFAGLAMGAQAGGMGYVGGVVFAIIMTGLILGFSALINCCVDSNYDNVTHFCSHCEVKLGTSDGYESYSRARRRR